MKFFPLLIAALFPALACAQEPAPEKPAAAKPAAEPAPLPEPAPKTENGKPGEAPPSLVPEGILPVKPPSQPRVKNTQKAPTTSVDLDARIRFRQAYNKAASDPKVQAIWEESRHVRTDYEKRDALRRFYVALYKKISAPDKALATMVAERERLSLRRLDQSRIEPTDPLDEEHRNE